MLFFIFLVFLPFDWLPFDARFIVKADWYNVVYFVKI